MKKLLDCLYRLPKKIIVFLVIGLLMTIFIVFVYAVAQNILRSEANDPQIQMAEEASFFLGHNGPMGPVVPELNVELSRSLDPFIQVYNEKGSVVDGNATLNGKIPHIPKEALDYAKGHGEHRLTWQPEKGTRIAAVISHYDGKSPGYVVTGRSLRLTEERIGNIRTLSFTTWVTLMIFLGATYFLLAKKS
jgi:hypothetical protein